MWRRGKGLANSVHLLRFSSRQLPTPPANSPRWSSIDLRHYKQQLIVKWLLSRLARSRWEGARRGHMMTRTCSVWKTSAVSNLSPPFSVSLAFFLWRERSRWALWACEQLTWDCMGSSDTPSTLLSQRGGHAWYGPLLAQIRPLYPRREHPSPYLFVRLVSFIYVVGEAVGCLDREHWLPRAETQITSYAH